MADDPVAPAATEVITWHVTPGKERDFENWAHGLTAVATRQEGHLGASWLRPDAAGGDYQVVVRFASEALLERWMGSDERRRWLARLDGVATADSVRQTGLETWFSLPGQSVRPPPRWKMATVTFAAVYPLSVVFNWLVARSVRGWALGARAALFPAALVPLLAFVIMPRVSRLLRHWLYGRA